jgi:nucleotide-binding universal stress UspA family protein
VADPAAVSQRWRQVLADVGYLRREHPRQGPRDAHVRLAQKFDESAVRDVAAFERVYERLANELDHIIRDYLKRVAPDAGAQKVADDSPVAALLGGFATSRKLPASAQASLRRAAAARNDLQHDYIHVRASEVFEGIGELLSGAEAALKEAAGAARALGADVETVAAEGEPGRVLARLADERACALVVVGASVDRREQLGPHSVGHTARFELDHSLRPVLLIRGQRAE